MRHLKIELTLTVVLLFAGIDILSAQTVHAIIACNTIDSKIGVGMASDMRNMRNAVQIIVDALGCEYSERVFDGNACTKANITDYLNRMEVERNDIVLFFYGGHGTHALDNSSDPWPQMCMNTNIESLFMPVASVEKLVADKHPWLRVIITNCCNEEQLGVTIKPLYAQSAGPTMQGDYNIAAFRKLFLESDGKVMMTSSKLGQLSWCGENGGLFTNNLLDAFDAVGKNVLAADWNAVCRSVHDKTLACNYLPGGVKQEPYYEVEINANDRNVPPAPPAPGTDNLFKALQVLVNQDYTKDQRLDRIPAVQSRFFTSDAHVVTVGRNGTSRIMYEDVTAFLRRLALSDGIKQVNVIEGDNTGVNSTITVHEIRY